MNKLTKLIGLALGIALAAVITSQANTAQIDAWNSACANYHFQGYPYNAHSTFREMYYGSDIENDFDALMGYVEATGGPISPPPTPDTDSTVLGE